MNNTNNLTIDDYLNHVDMVDYYITKNILQIIKKKKNIEFLKTNIFLLAINNKNNKNSLIILLENGKYNVINKLIEFDYNILNYKNMIGNNLFKMLIGYEYFYDIINKKIKNLERNFVIKILTFNNNNNLNFIDNLITLLNTNNEYFSNNFENKKHKLLLKIIDISHNIYLLDAEKYTFIITKLCKTINNENFLLNILKIYNIDNFDIFPDNNLLTCIDYLIINESFDVLMYLLDKINYIEFINIGSNNIFELCKNDNIDAKTKTNIIIKILYKSNISKFKNNKNQNIFYLLIINYDIDIHVIMNFIDFINIYEQDIYGKSLFDLIKTKYTKNEIHTIKNFFSKQLVNYNKFEKIYKKINVKSKLVKSDIGIFNSNIIHNMLYTICILEENVKYLKIPYFVQSEIYKKKQEEYINISNNEKSIIGYLKLFFTNFNNWLPHLIIWKNKYNYWLDPNLIDILNKSKHINFLYIKLSVYLIDNMNIRHSNVIIINNITKIVERFEPYGEMAFTNSSDINKMISEQISNPLGYKFNFVQPYPGFQSRSDEFAKYNKTYGDPMGFCLSWSFLYIDIKMELFKMNSDINPIDFINWYIINKFFKDFDINEDTNKTNKYILFIRYYARYLDIKKNKLIEKFKLDPSLSYQNDMEGNFHNKLVTNINLELNKICSV